MNEHINEEGLCYCGSLDCIGHLRVIADKATSELATVRKELNNVQAMKHNLQVLSDGYERRLAMAKELIEKAIRNSDISAEECQEPFWEELFEALGVSATKEVEFTFKVEYSGTMTLPIGEDIQDYAGAIDIPDISLDDRGASIDNVSCDDWQLDEA
jgi:hypothetical protein